MKNPVIFCCFLPGNFVVLPLPVSPPSRCGAPTACSVKHHDSKTIQLSHGFQEIRTANPDSLHHKSRVGRQLTNLPACPSMWALPPLLLGLLAPSCPSSVSSKQRSPEPSALRFFPRLDGPAGPASGCLEEVELPSLAAMPPSGRGGLVRNKIEAMEPRVSFWVAFRCAFQS